MKYQLPAQCAIHRQIQYQTLNTIDVVVARGDYHIKHVIGPDEILITSE